MGGFLSGFNSCFSTTESKELPLPQILEKLRIERPNFPMYLRRFTSPYFIYFNDVEFQGQLYIIYAGKNHSTIADMEFFRYQLPILELKDTTSSDCGIMKATSKFTF
jgi:hypothetical protein